MEIGLITSPFTKIALKNSPNFWKGRATPKVIKYVLQLPRKMGHGPKECHPTIIRTKYIYFIVYFFVFKLAGQSKKSTARSHKYHLQTEIQ